MIEALEGVATTDAAQLILAMALSSSEYETVPQQPDDLEYFLTGALQEAITWTLDVHAAESVISHLTPMVAMARSQVRPVAQHAPSSSPAPVVDGRFVLLATSDAECVPLVAAVLGPRVRVQHIEDVYDLVAAVERERENNPTILLDCQAPAIDLHALAHIMPLVPEVRVVLWGSVSYERQSIAGLYPGATEWVCCDGGTESLRDCLDGV